MPHTSNHSAVDGMRGVHFSIVTALAATLCLVFAQDTCTRASALPFQVPPGVSALGRGMAPGGAQFAPPSGTHARAGSKETLVPHSPHFIAPHARSGTPELGAAGWNAMAPYGVYNVRYATMHDLHTTSRSHGG